MIPNQRAVLALAAAGAVLLTFAAGAALASSTRTETVTVTVPVPSAVPVTVTASPAPRPVGLGPAACIASDHWSLAAAHAAEQLGLIYSANAQILTDTKVALQLKDQNKLNALQTRQIALYNATGVQNDALAQALLKYGQVQPACEAALK